MPDAVTDMVNLVTLDEESMVENLRQRFVGGDPYTTCGRIVISVNPFRWLPIYSDALVEQYHAEEDPFSTLPPHVYSISHAALREVATAASRGGPMRSQSILVSGESGAGKTEATKICMKYLATVDALCGGGASAMSSVITERVLQSSPVLEAYGNAQTVRNDNSSRFGKFMKLHYSSGSRQLGAHIDTYLLERSRVVRPPCGEANYHVLYQLAGGAEPAVRAKLQLGDEMSYAALPVSERWGGRPAAAARQAQWVATSTALSAVGFSDDEKDQLSLGLSGVLALSRLSFDGADDSEGQRAAFVVGNGDADGPLARVAALLEVDPAVLADALTTRRTYLPTGDQYVKPLDEKMAADGCDALGKAVYGRMFDGIVGRLNVLISAGAADEGQSFSEADATFIGILDIFGFESFAVNSFEQLCINFANEVLQQQFNADVFRQQQKEYEAEGIPWQTISYQDNGPTLELLRGKREGLFTLLDEECRLQTGNPAAFVQKISQAHAKSELLSMPKIQKDRENPSFEIAHYAGLVSYDTALFLQKNTDPLHPELLEMMQTSGSAFLATLFEPQKASATGAKEGRRGALYSTTIGARFKEQLAGLMASISATQVHYIRCVKPNAANKPHEYEPPLVTEQLRCAGMLEAVRISRAAYPHRLPRGAVALRFGSLAAHVARLGGKPFERVEPRHMTTPQLKQALASAGVPAADGLSKPELEALLAAAGGAGLATMLALLLPEGSDGPLCCIGKTKVFFKGASLPGLESRRTELCAVRVLTLQSHARRMVAARFFVRAKAAIPKAWFRMVSAVASYRTRLEEAKVRATYEGQLKEARVRLEQEASERANMTAEHERLRAQLEKSKSTAEVAEAAQTERREQAQEYAMLLKQQELELQSLRGELDAAKSSIRSSDESRLNSERKAEQSVLQLSVERSNHLKLQRTFELEKAAHTAAKTRLRAIAADPSNPAAAAASAPLVPEEPAGVGKRQAAGADAEEMASRDATIAQLRAKLAHAETERDRDKHKLQRTVDAALMKRREWEREKQGLKRQLENLEAEVKKRDKWLEKAKDIIKEYQKRHAPGAPSSTPPASGARPATAL